MTRRKPTVPSRVDGDGIDRPERTIPTSQAKEEARALHILGGVYPFEAEELARAARTVRRIAPADADVILAALGLSKAS